MHQTKLQDTSSSISERAAYSIVCYLMAGWGTIAAIHFFRSVFGQASHLEIARGTLALNILLLVGLAFTRLIVGVVTEWKRGGGRSRIKEAVRDGALLMIAVIPLAYIGTFFLAFAVSSLPTWMALPGAAACFIGTGMLATVARQERQEQFGRLGA